MNKTPRQLLDDFKATDMRLVNEFNDYANWHGVTIEQRLIFMGDRTAYVAGALVRLCEALMAEIDGTHQTGVQPDGT